MANATAFRASVNSYFGLDNGLFKVPSRATSLELYLDRQEDAKNAAKKALISGDLLVDTRVIPARSLMLDENNRIIGALDMNNKVRRLWPISSAFLPRKEEIDPETFKSRLSRAEIMIPIVKEVFNKFFKKLNVDQVFSRAVIDAHLSTENLAETLAHFDMEDERSIEKSVVAALQAAVYAHIVEKGFTEGDLGQLAVDLNSDIITIQQLVMIDSARQFEATAEIFKNSINELSKTLSPESVSSSMAAAFDKAIAKAKKA
jgi:hypothetical protein